MARHRRHPVRKAIVFMLTLASLAGFLWWDNDSVQTEYFEYDSRRLPRSFDGYRIAVLSDLHDKSFGEGNRRLMSAVNAVQPDLIAVTGDLVDRFRGMDPDYIQTTAAGLREIAPVYYVTGNHEWALGGVPELKQMLSDSGWTVLSNEYVTLKNDGESIVLAGIDDPNGHADQKTPEELAEELHTECGDPYWILLAHRNDRFEDQYSLLGADLTLSGHGHGGMVRLPFTDGLIGTQRNWFPSYTAGFYTAHGSTVFVSRGLGNSGASFRLFNRPQVAVVTLGCKK